MKLDPFYLIVDSADWIDRLVPLGVKLVQLRIKDSRRRQNCRADIRSAKSVCAAHGCQLIVNDYWQLAIEEGCDFVHLGQEDLAEADLAAIRAAGLKLGRLAPMTRRNSERRSQRSRTMWRSGRSIRRS